MSFEVTKTEVSSDRGEVQIYANAGDEAIVLVTRFNSLASLSAFVAAVQRHSKAAFGDDETKSKPRYDDTYFESMAMLAREEEAILCNGDVSPSRKK